ncbi:MAG TPA: bile acid:sodium symporter family protein [Bordetella sp.]
MQAIARFSRFVGNTFALWVLLFSVLAYVAPDSFKWLGAYIVPLLGLVMFGMGLTLSRDDFRAVLRQPGVVAIGVVGHFAIMPTIAWALTKLLHLPPEIAVGVILVGCCPGGTASNVVSLLARGDIALSVAITAVTTLLAPIATPALIYFLAHQWLHVDAASMFWSIVQVVLVPIALGAAAQYLFRSRIQVFVQVLPIVSVAAIVIIVAAVVAGSRASLAQSGLLIFLAVVLHNGFGLLLGYLLGKVFHLPVAQRKALSIEVGMQNSGLGVALAHAHFSPLAAVPSAIFSVWHNISGALVATLYRRFHDAAPQAAQTAAPGASANSAG